MFVDVETFLLDAGRYTKTVELLDAIEESESTSCCPKVDDEDAEALSTEESPTVTIESTV